MWSLRFQVFPLCRPKSNPERCCSNFLLIGYSKRLLTDRNDSNSVFQVFLYFWCPAYKIRSSDLHSVVLIVGPHIQIAGDIFDEWAAWQQWSHSKSHQYQFIVILRGIWKANIFTNRIPCLKIFSTDSLNWLEILLVVRHCCQNNNSATAFICYWSPDASKFPFPQFHENFVCILLSCISIILSYILLNT